MTDITSSKAKRTAADIAPERADRSGILSVAVAAPVSGIYDYIGGSFAELPRGSLVEVPFGGRHLPGIVMGAAPGNVTPAKLRPIFKAADLPVLGEPLLAFIERVAGWTMAPIGAVVKMVVSQPAAFTPLPKKKFYLLGQPKDNAGRITPARQRVLTYLADGVGRPTSDIVTACKTSKSVLDGMEQQRLLFSEWCDADTLPPRPQKQLYRLQLTTEQQLAADQLVAAIGGGYKSFLLDGVTGSGKTEVYFAAVETALAAGKQVLILLPEIALSAGWRHRFLARFGVEPAEWHSDVTTAQKRRSWRFIITGQTAVVVGARSSLFLPFVNLGLIIVDEEHEHAFKQEDQVIYQARDMAVLRARLEQGAGGAGECYPRLESWVNAGRTGAHPRYSYLHLPNRAQGAVLPQIHMVNLRETPPEAGRWLAPPLVAAINARLALGEQSLLYLNRRGYAPLTLCGACGTKLTCPNCDAWMVDHRLAGRMRCHHCGHESRPDNRCQTCGESDQMRACGPGVERLAEEVLWRFPGARFVVLSSDTVNTPKAAAMFVQSVLAGEVDIIIGTQMAAKGHHFPDLTLVGVVDADLGLAGGDLRAAERTFQMLNQVAGRAGRESRPGWRCYRH